MSPGSASILRKWGVVPMVALAAFLGGLLAPRLAFVESLEMKTLDWRFQARLSPEWQPAESPCLAAISDGSISALGRWPWSRSVMARLVEGLSRHGARSIGVDVLFVEPDLRDPAADAALSRAIREAGNVVLAEALEEDRIISPLAAFADGASTGLVSMPRDADGVVRRIPLVVEWRGRRYLAISLIMACRQKGIAPESVRVEAGRVILPLPEGGHVVIPVDAGGRYLVNYRQRTPDFLGGGAAQFLDAMDDPASKADLQEMVANRPVLVGFTATGFDVMPTPVEATSPGVAVHYTVLSNILNRDFLAVPPPWVPPVLQMILVTGTFLLAGRLRTAAAISSSLGLVAAYGACVFGLFILKGLVLPLVVSLATGLAVIFLVTWFRLATEEREKRRIRSTFNRLLSRNVLEAVLQDPSLLRMGGVRRELTVLFADVRGFTNWCETRPPEEIVPVLNELLDALTPVIFRHQGTLDKYIGDAVMAFWGAPQNDPDHAFNAVRAALEMQGELVRLRESWKSRGITELRMGIGINTGPMVVGNMGSSDVVSYTVIGDAVNLGSRLETLTRQYDAEIVVGEETWRRVQDRVLGAPLGEVSVKGKSRPVPVFRVDGLR